jgi:hypothetical protein
MLSAGLSGRKRKELHRKQRIRPLHLSMRLGRYSVIFTRWPFRVVFALLTDLSTTINAKPFRVEFALLKHTYHRVWNLSPIWFDSIHVIGSILPL